MEKFGKSKEFSIWVEYYSVLYKNDPDYLANGPSYKSGGYVYFWINGRNLFEMLHNGKELTFWGDVDVLSNFFCEKLKYLIIEDPFPVKTKSITGRDMMEETLLIKDLDDDLSKILDVDWNKVDMNERDKIHSWNVNHGLLTNNGGLFLPDGYFRKDNEKIEYSWQDEKPHKGNDGEYRFKYPKGVEYIDIKLFKETVVAFCLDYIERFKEFYPSLNEDRKELQKAIDIVV